MAEFGTVGGMAKKGKAGRPEGTKFYGLPIRSSGSPDLIARIETWQNKTGVVNFSEAIRQLIERGLKAEGVK